MGPSTGSNFAIPAKKGGLNEVDLDNVSSAIDNHHVFLIGPIDDLLFQEVLSLATHGKF